MSRAVIDRSVYPWSKHDLKDLKERCNEQSWEQGLHVPEKGKTFAGEVREETVAWSKDTYQLLKQAEQGKVKSYVQDIALAVLDCKETATSRETFIRLMNERGYGVDWQDSHKFGSVFFEGKTIPCISLKGQKVFHSGYELRDKDKHDISILESLSK